MKTIIPVLAVVGLASAGVIPVPVAPLVGHVATQYHAQDELGQYSYGYAGGPSAKEEIKTADGITRGGYSYVDGNGLVQSAAYVSDPVNGFRVAATNLPAGPAVPAGPEPIAVIPAAAPVLPAAVASSSIVADASLSPVIIQSAVSPITIQQEVPAAPVVETIVEEPTATIDAGAELPKSEETVSAPEAPAEAAPEATVQQLVTPIQDTPEVLAAKAAHLAAVEEVKLRDAAQEAIDAQENNINTSDPENSSEKTDEGIEQTEAAPEVTELPKPSPAGASEPVSPAEPAAIQTPAVTASQADVTPSVVATQLIPAAYPVATPIVSSVLTREVVAAPVASAPALAISSVAAAPAVAAVPGVIVGAPVAPSPSGPVALEHVGQITSQYHAQDELGQYMFGYSGGPSAKHEVKTVDGLTSGGYSYIDSHGLVQSAAYVSDPVNGFRVAATNIPKQREPEYIADSPDVEEAKQKLFKAQAEHIAKL